jgi:hypothetical protein
VSVPSNVEDLRRELARGLDELDAETARLDALPRSKYRTSQHCWKLIGRTTMLARELRERAPGDEAVARYDRDVDLAGLRSERAYQAVVTAPAKTPHDWAKVARTRTTGPRRRKALAKIAGKLLSQGVDGELVVELMRAQDRYRCDPPLGGAEVGRLVRWAASREADRLEEAA